MRYLHKINSFPGRPPGGGGALRPRRRQKRRGTLNPTPQITQTQALGNRPLSMGGFSGIMRAGAVCRLLCRRSVSCIGARGVHSAQRPATICLATTLYHKTGRRTSSFFAPPGPAPRSGARRIESAGRCPGRRFPTPQNSAVSFYFNSLSSHAKNAFAAAESILLLSASRL